MTSGPSPPPPGDPPSPAEPAPSSQHGAPDAGWYARAFLAHLPRALTLVDRDPSSPTYGCFDRNHWHYRTQDFPSGMYQELALPLAQAFAWDLPGSPWRGAPRLRELALAGVDFAARSAHADGSCDDYFPQERALGATAFAASAAAAVLDCLDDRDPDRLAFLRRRCEWLLAARESGRLTNHHALVALAVARTARLLGDDALRRRAGEPLERCLAWQHEEGWFAEYEGADPGYQSLTLAFLAALRDHLPGPELDAALARGLGFAAHFLHPDGSYGGETGSRNTCQVLPSGFERLAGEHPAARHLADGWLAGAGAGRRGHADDDRIFGHGLHDWATAHRLRAARGAGGPAPWRPPEGVTDFPGAGLCVVRDGPLTLVIAPRKGAVLRAYHGERLLHNDTGLVARVGPDRWVSHGVDAHAEVERAPRTLVVRGRFQRAPRHLPTPLRQVAFRVGNATAGRLAPGAVRRILQAVLITGHRPAPLRFERRIAWHPDSGVEITDRVAAAEPRGRRVERLWASTDATSIYVATSNLWQQASLEGWIRLDAAAARLREEGACEVVRRFT